MSVQAKEVLRQFDAGIAKLRSEVLKNLDSVDVLDKDAARGLVDRLNQRLVVAQHEFLDFVSRVTGSSHGDVEEFELSSSDGNLLPEFAAGAMGAGTGAILVNLIAWTVPGWLWGTTTTLATAVATAIGVGASAVTLGAAAVAGVAVGSALYAYRLRQRRKYVRDSILEAFDEDAVPKLRAWASQITEGMSRKLEGK
jgi:hypothetical protein